MTEQDLVDLGFTKYEEFNKFDTDYLAEDAEELQEEPYYYYVYDLDNNLSFISSDSDSEEALNGEWFVDIFDTYPAVRFTDKEEVQQLINQLNSRTVVVPMT